VGDDVWVAKPPVTEEFVVVGVGVVVRLGDVPGESLRVREGATVDELTMVVNADGEPVVVVLERSVVVEESVADGRVDEGSVDEGMPDSGRVDEVVELGGNRVVVVSIGGLALLAAEANPASKFSNLAKTMMLSR
jgi:sulfur carrier protein ThiS